MITVVKIDKKREIKVDARFAYPLNNLGKSERMNLARAVAERTHALGLEDADVVLDKIVLSGRLYAFGARERNGIYTLDIGPGTHVPAMRVVREGSRVAVTRLSRDDLLDWAGVPA